MSQLDEEIFKDFFNIKENEWISDLIPQPELATLEFGHWELGSKDFDNGENAKVTFKMPNSATFIAYVSSGGYWLSTLIGDWGDYVSVDSDNLDELAISFLTLLDNIT